MNESLKFNDEAVKVVEVVGEILKSRTQSVKVLVIEKDSEKYVSVQKWWRKSADSEWLEGKGFHFNYSETEDIKGFLEKASVC